MFIYINAYKLNMVVKTITVTKEAYEALRSLKSKSESFSETILKIAKRKPLDNFYGILNKEKGDKLEKAIYDVRKTHNIIHSEKINKIVKILKEE